MTDTPTHFFRDLPIGTIFRRARGGPAELVKIAPVLRPNGSVQYNARYIGGRTDGRLASIGHGTKCLVPPYEQGAKPPSEWAQLNHLVQAAGWRNVSEFHAALLDGVVEVPRMPE